MKTEIYEFEIKGLTQPDGKVRYECLSLNGFRLLLDPLTDDQTHHEDLIGEALEVFLPIWALKGDHFNLRATLGSLKPVPKRFEVTWPYLHRFVAEISIEPLVEYLQRKIKVYEDFLHRINLYQISMDSQGIGDLVQNACRWSYAHRVGNGEYSPAEQQETIEKAFGRLLETKRSQ